MPLGGLRSRIVRLRHSANDGAKTIESYSYDPVGNRLSSLSVPSYTYNASNELTSTSAATYTYDNNGNTLTKALSSGNTQYTWDFENRLSSVALPGSGGTVTFKYDPLGRRIQKAFTQSSTTTTTNYVYDGANDVEEVDQSSNTLGRYTQGAGIDEELGELRSGASSYYEADGLGSITSLTGSAGAIANSYTYDTFGNLTVSSGSATNPFQYTGRDYDPETGLRYYRARYYDSNTGRFLSEDPTRFGAGMNFYDYVNNDPADGMDPSGLLRVCCRPLRRWSTSPDPFQKFLWWLIIRHRKHCYIELSPGIPIFGHPETIGVHPPPDNDKGPQYPIPNQSTDNLNKGGECKDVPDATPCKLQQLQNEIDNGTCFSCGKDYSNGLSNGLLGCFNNSNTYVYDLISGAGMTPPPMKGAPGYHPHGGGSCATQFSPIE